MLRAMVAEHAGNLLHAADQSHVAHQHDELEHALNQRAPAPQRHEPRQQPGQRSGHHHKQNKRQNAAQHGRHGHDEIGSFVAEFFGHPFVELCFLQVRVLSHGDFGALHKALVARDQAVDKVEYSPHEGPFLPGMRPDGRHLGKNLSVRLAHSHAHFLRAAHHHALHKGLSAHARFKAAGFFIFVVQSDFLSADDASINYPLPAQRPDSVSRRAGRPATPGKRFNPPPCRRGAARRTEPAACTEAGARSPSCRVPPRFGCPRCRPVR